MAQQTRDHLVHSNFELERLSPVDAAIEFPPWNCITFIYYYIIYNMHSVKSNSQVIVRFDI